MSESITFPEARILEVVQVVRAGLAAVKVPREVKRELKRQCDELERYWKRCQELG